MSDELIFAEKAADLVLAGVLARYKLTTGVTLAPADPRRLHMHAVVLELAHQRVLIDFSAKQNLLRFVSELYIAAYAELWGEEPLPALPSTCTERFNFASSSARTIAAGVRVTDGTNIWQVTEDTSDTAAFIDAPVECIVTGKATNGVAIGQIDTLVDPTLVPGCLSVENTTETISGRDVEGLEDFRTRLRDVPESRSTCGPRTAYQAAALEASASVADAVALGPNDSAFMAGTAPEPGQVHVCIIMGARDDDGVLESVEPEPEAGLLTTVEEALTAEDVRPLTDFVTVKAAEFVDYDSIATYYIGRSRAKQATQIQDAVEEAYDAYQLWQQSKIGRDINPSELVTRLVNAGAKRVAVADPTFTALMRDEAARLSYSALVYGGVEDD
jgi:phage-related baseplate assembly protein